ncbi:MAG: hypothetical protein ABSD99_04875 [Candidatus Bathyarchaeia archaeon]
MRNTKHWAEEISSKTRLAQFKWHCKPIIQDGYQRDIATDDRPYGKKGL